MDAELGNMALVTSPSQGRRDQLRAEADAEKRRVIFRGLIPAPIADRYIRKVESEEERRLLREALDSSSG